MQFRIIEDLSRITFFVILSFLFEMNPNVLEWNTATIVINLFVIMYSLYSIYEYVFNKNKL